MLQLSCPGLVEAIERADDGEAALLALSAQLDEIAAKLRQAGVDTVVLGCTHYPLVADALQQRLGPAVQLIDTAEAVARRVASLLPSGQPGSVGTMDDSGGGDSAAGATGTTGAAPTGLLRLLATGDTATLQRAAQRWLAASGVVERLALPPPDGPPRA